MHLLPDKLCSEVELLEIQLHSWPEDANAGWLLGTRTPAPFLPHWRRRANPALWHSKITVLKEPVFHQSRFQKAGDEFQKTPISNAFCQALEQNFVMHIVKRSHN
jgi:hypothetical protein